MRFTKTLIFLISVGFFYSSIALGQDSTIRILAVVPQQEFDLSTTRMRMQLGILANSWNTSGLPGAAAVTVQILNAGVPVIANSVIVLDAIDPSKGIQGNPVIRSLRGQNEADVVILFTRQISRRNEDGTVAGGIAPVPPDFVPGSGGLDLRRRNNAFVAIVDPTLDITNTAHEFGHLLGGGHETVHPTQQDRLFPDCKAKFSPAEMASTPVPIGSSATGTPTIASIPVPSKFFITSIVSPAVDLKGVPPGNIVPLEKYSRFPTNDSREGDESRNNFRCLLTFAKSVANYFVPQAPGDNLFPPINLSGTFRDCIRNDFGDVASRYIFSFRNDPRTTAPVNSYDVFFASPPTSSVYQYAFTLIDQRTEDLVVVNGANGSVTRVRVTACSTNTCSNRSSEFFDASQRCVMNNF